MRLFTPGLAKIGLHIHREIRPPTAETKAARKLASVVASRDGHGLGPSMGWIGSGRILQHM